MIEFTCRVENRDFTTRPPSALQLRPLRWGWAMPGGPAYAQIEVRGGRDALWEILTWLRCPLVIYGPNNVPLWWGYVSDAALMDGGIEHRVSLDGMANRVAVAYSYVEPGSQEVGTRRTTSWIQDDTSVNTYGTKDLLVSIDGASDARAEGVRAETLAQRQYPQVISSAEDGREGGTVLARGWWSTLDWRYYVRNSTNSMETTEQIATMVSGFAQFLTGVDILNTTAISYSGYQNGERTMSDLMDGWLRTPTSGGQRLTAWVTPERLLRVEAESTADRWLLLPGNEFRSAVGERRLAPGELPIGRTALRGVIPASANLTWLGAPSPFVVEEAEYGAVDNSIRWRPRGLPSPWELSRVVQG